MEITEGAITVLLITLFIIVSIVAMCLGILYRLGAIIDEIHQITRDILHNKPKPINQRVALFKSEKMKKTYVFDRLDDVLGNYEEGIATAEDVVTVALKVRKYLFENPHPHDILNFMDKHGLGPEDMIDDNTYPPRI